MKKIIKGLTFIIILSVLIRFQLYGEGITDNENSLLEIEEIELNSEESTIKDNDSIKSDEDEDIHLFTEKESEIKENNDIDEIDELEEIETNINKDFIEETSSGQSINDYEKEVLEKINDIIESSEFEITNESEKEQHNVLESFIEEVIDNNIEDREFVEDLKEANIDSVENITTISNIEVSTMSEILDIDVENDINTDVILGAGNHSSNNNPRVKIHSTYDRYEIYTGDNIGTVSIFDNNGNYYNGDTKVKVIRDMVDSHNNSPILLNLASNVSFFNFDNSNDNYVLLPDGFVEDIVARYSGNGYLNPQGINKLDHIEVNVEFNNTDLGKYDLFEYGVLYYLSCYEGVLGEYYYYDPNTTDIDRAASFYVNNRIMERTYNIVSEYYYKSPSGEQLSFKPSWIINNDNLTGSNKEKYLKQWVNFPYFLIKTGEKYWNIRDSIEQSTYLTEYSEGYYEQYLTERPYGNVSERLVVLDNIYKTEDDLINDSLNNMSVHPYVKSNSITITGNFRPDNINDSNKLRAGGILPYDTYAILNINVAERRAKTVQVYLNGEKLITNNNKGLYALNDGKCQIRIDASKLLDEEKSRNVISFILLDESSDYITDERGRIINSFISLIRSSSINKNKYKISFNSNGGTKLPDISVEEGNVLSLPTDPTKSRVVFQGWYNDPDFKNKFDLNEYIFSDKTLYALWGQKTPNVKPTNNGNVNTGGSGGSSGGGSGGGGGNGGGIGTNIGTITSNTLSTIEGTFNLNINRNNYSNVAVKGNWYKNGNKWSFIDSNGVNYKNRWALIDTSNNPMIQNADWYRFDEYGNMLTGYYIENGKVYYFNDGFKNVYDEGKMLVGWH